MHIDILPTVLFRIGLEEGRRDVCSIEFFLLSACSLYYFSLVEVEIEEAGRRETMGGQRRSVVFHSGELRYTCAQAFLGQSAAYVCAVGINEKSRTGNCLETLVSVVAQLQAVMFLGWRKHVPERDRPENV